MTDEKILANLIDADNREKWTSELRRLRIGQAVTVGAIEIGGRPINQPIITYSAYREPEGSLRGISHMEEPMKNRE